MITRVNDFSSISDESLNKLANIINNKENKKMVDIIDINNTDKIMALKNELKVMGYKVETQIFGDKIKILASVCDKIPFNDDINKNFKKLAWGRYCFQRESGIGDLIQYPFNDGSIWKVITDTDGKEYLVKEVDDEDDDKIVRQASKLTKMADINCYIDDENFASILQILYNNNNINSEFLNDLLNSELKSSIYSLIGKKMNQLISEIINSNNITDENQINQIIQMIDKNIDNNQITSKEILNDMIKNYCQEIIFKNQNYLI